MGYPYLKVKRVEEDPFVMQKKIREAIKVVDFAKNDYPWRDEYSRILEKQKKLLERYTVEELKGMLRRRDMKVSGLKDELITRLAGAKTGLRATGDNPHGPMWFIYSDFFEKGAKDEVFFICICGQFHKLPMRKKGEGDRCGTFKFKNSQGGIVPSIVCDDARCRFHIWGQLDGIEKEEMKEKGFYFYDSTGNTYKDYNFAEIQMKSRLWNPSWGG